MNALPLVLASSSPRRKELLEALGLPFVADASDADESVPAGMPPATIVETLALRKAAAVAARRDGALVIGADTIVVCEGEVLGKPRDDADARRMLAMLQGREHDVYSGVALVAAGASRAAHSRTRVRMKPLGAERIAAYVRTGEPRDKAGAYAIQGFGATLVSSIDGDYFTVVGLPVALLADMLAEFGIAAF